MGELLSEGAARSKPKWRTLADFGDLHPAEQFLLSAVREGVDAIVAKRRPAGKRPDNEVRAEFIRFLALGGDERAPVHERGIHLGGAFITGPLDLSGCIVTMPINLLWCRFKLGVFCSGASLGYLNLVGSALAYLTARGTTASSIKLNSRFAVSHGCDLRGATIDGELDCSGGKFETDSPEDAALDCTGIRVSGNVLLTRSSATGKVLFRRARIGGELNCNSGTLENPGKLALSCAGARIDGTLYLGEVFGAKGEVDLRSCTIAGSLTCQRGLFHNPGGNALSLDGAIIERFLYFRRATVDGCVSLVGTRAGALCDDVRSWEGATLRLNGFRYDRIEGGPTDAATRIAWLKKQPVPRQPDDFWPQPWEHLAKILREMGHVEDSKLVSIQKQVVRRDLGVVGQRRTDHPSWALNGYNRALNLVSRTVHRLFGVFAGYGHRPMRTVAWMIGVWLACSIVYGVAAERGLLAPTAHSVYTGKAKADCGFDKREPWTRCKAMPPEYTGFSPAIYSLDVILPLLDLKQETEWRPIVRKTGGGELEAGLWLRRLMWVEIVFGWVTSLLLVSVLGRIIEKD